MDIRGFKDTIAWYDNNAEAYAASADKVNFEPRVDVFLEMFPPNPSILEAGCGTGREARLFHKKGAHVVGVDISDGLLEIARRESPEITYITANFVELPFEDNLFDGVWAHASLVHLETIEEVEQTLKEFNRVLKPDGLLYIYVKLQQGEEKTAIVSDSLSNHDRFFRYYTEDELADLLFGAGFNVQEQVIEEDPHGREEVKWIRVIARNN